VLVALFVWSPAGAVEQTIRGKILNIANPGVAAKRRVLCTANKPLSTNTLVGNPTVDAPSSR